MARELRIEVDCPECRRELWNQRTDESSWQLHQTGVQDALRAASATSSGLDAIAEWLAIHVDTHSGHNPSVSLSSPEAEG